MKNSVCVVLLILVIGSTVSAQQLENQPTIHADYSVSFTVVAPAATSVQVMPWGNDDGMGRDSFEKTKDEDGLRHVTVPPVRPGFHYYHLLIDGQYRTLADREHRGLAGLSMGGMQTMQYGLPNLDWFASLAVSSGIFRTFDLETAYGGVYSDPDAFNEKVKLFFIANGTMDGGYNASLEMHHIFDEAGVQNVWFECKETHEWQAWRKQFHALAPLLFTEP